MAVYRRSSRPRYVLLLLVLTAITLVTLDERGDGLLDLIVGWGDGSVAWYRNVGSRTEPKLAKGITLVRPAPWPSYDENAPPSEDNRPGVRAKVKIHCRKRPLSWWVWRSVNDLFNLGLM